MVGSVRGAWALEGPSGVGKTTIARNLERPGRWTSVAEAYDRLRPRPSLRFSTPVELRSLERRLLGEEIRRMRVAARLVRAGERAILDTSPLGPAVYTAAWAALEPEYGPVAEEMTASVVRSLRNGTLGLPVRVVVLTVPESDLREGGRAVRPRRPSDLAARHLRVARGERRFWRRLAARSSGSVRFVRATGSVAEVAYRAERALLRAGPPLTVRAVVAELRSFAGSATPGPTSTLKNRT